MSSGTEVLISDAVGFVQKLLTQLIAAFQATLEEIEVCVWRCLSSYVGFAMISGCMRRGLFATLDPTRRKVELPSGTELLISDTVGLVQKLPTQLIAAFRATLEEIKVRKRR
jgi:50S ribosomal subunit-associated GTPase HflX